MNQLEDQLSPPRKKKPRVFLWGAVFCLAVALSGLVAALTLMTLQSRYGIERPWFEPVLSGLRGVVVTFMAGCLVFKIATQIFDDHS
jgi:hypothetical protein